MIDLKWYLAIVTLLVVTVALWETISRADSRSIREQANNFMGLCVEFTISAGAYWILVFILSLAIATALWLILLLVIWVPSDFFQNYAGMEVFSKALQNIRPIIYRTASSPGITSIPLMDYVSLYAAFILGPWLGIWSILSKHQENNAPSSAKS
ncbi:hypothetical protein [Kaarinaea lacus]